MIVITTRPYARDLTIGLFAPLVIVLSFNRLRLPRSNFWLAQDPSFVSREGKKEEKQRGNSREEEGETGRATSSSILNSYTVSEKRPKCFFGISSVKLGRFRINFTNSFFNKFAAISCKYFPPHLNNVSTLPCEN